MGMKRAPAMPPPVDQSVVDRTAEKEAKFEKEKQKMAAAKAKGQYGTVLTTGMGVEEEADTAKTALGGTLS
tara:strand:+ start:505 stop:717 length:213 start_codon:yes stop_codon:yes gene_type:complete